MFLHLLIFVLFFPISVVVRPSAVQANVNLVAIVVPICIVTVILGTILLILFIRHKRLQRSFLAYASSHYDPRSERTTFNSAEYLGKQIFLKTIYPKKS